MARARHQGGTVPDLAWQARAACRGESLDLFFGPEGESAGERAYRERGAVAVCEDCPVRQECLRHALAVPEKYGVWGGLTETQRGTRRRRRPRVAA